MKGQGNSARNRAPSSAVTASTYRRQSTRVRAPRWCPSVICLHLADFPDSAAGATVRRAPARGRARISGLRFANAPGLSGHARQIEERRRTGHRAEASFQPCSQDQEVRAPAEVRAPTHELGTSAHAAVGAGHPTMPRQEQRWKGLVYKAAPPGEAPASSSNTRRTRPRYWTA